MYNGLLHLHNLLRWVIIILGFIAIYKSFAGMRGNKLFTNSERKIGLFLMISAHITLLIGLYQWFAGGLGWQNISSYGVDAVMKDPVYRFFAIEHPAGMLIAIILITIGRGASKKNISDLAKHKRTFWFFLVAMIIILASVPWPFRVGIGKPWFPGVH
jgi:hypothetical protein